MRKNLGDHERFFGWWLPGERNYGDGGGGGSGSDYGGGVVRKWDGDSTGGGSSDGGGNGSVVMVVKVVVMPVVVVGMSPPGVKLVAASESLTIGKITGYVCTVCSPGPPPGGEGREAVSGSKDIQTQTP